MVAIAAGLFLRFHRLGEPLWYDEAVSVKTASVALADLPRQLTSGEDSNPPLYPLLLKLWLALTDGSDASLHLLSALIGTLAVFSAGWAGWRLCGARAGFSCAALMALHPWAIVYSQETRAYELLVLLSLWSCYFLARALGADRRSWYAFAALTLANLYTHNYAVFLLAAQGVWVWLEARRDPGLRRAALTAAGAALLGYSPWLFFAWRQAQALPQVSAVGWHDVVFSLYSAAGLWVMAGPLVCHWPPAFLPPLLLADAALAAYALLQPRQNPSLTRGLIILSTVTIAIPLLLSLVHPIYTTGRHNIVTLPALCLLAALSLEAIPGARRRTAALAFVLAAALYPTVAYFSAPKSFERQIAEFIEAHDRPGYKILLYPTYRGLAIGHYYAKALQAPEAVVLRTPADLPAGLVIMVEKPRVLNPAQAEMLSRFYDLDAVQTFGLSTVAVMIRRKPA